MMLGYDMKSVRIDTEKTVVRIGVKMDQAGEGEIMGLKMEDAEGGFVVDEVWKEGEGSWAWQDIEDGHEVIGFHCSCKVIPDHFPRFGFLLWKPELKMPGWIREDDLESFQEQSAILIERSEVSKNQEAASA